MVSAIKPGGWLLVEEGDCINFAAIDQNHALSRIFDVIVRKVLEFHIASRDVDPFFGRKLLALMKRLELDDLDHEGKIWIREGGGEIGMYYETMFGLFRDDYLRGAGILEADFDSMIQAFNDPSFFFTDEAVFAAWGRKPKK